MIAEAIESLAAADAAGNSGAILADGIACYVDASADQIADEMRAAAEDDSESFGREVSL